MHVGVRKGQVVAVAQAEPTPERQIKLSARSYQRLNKPKWSAHHCSGQWGVLVTIKPRVHVLLLKLGLQFLKNRLSTFRKLHLKPEAKQQCLLTPAVIWTAKTLRHSDLWITHEYNASVTLSRASEPFSFSWLYLCQLLPSLHWHVYACCFCTCLFLVVNEDKTSVSWWASFFW